VVGHGSAWHGPVRFGPVRFGPVRFGQEGSKPMSKKQEAESASMGTRSFAVRITGITGLVMNSNASLLDGGVDKGRDKAEYERQHFRDLCYRHGNGDLYIPARAIKKCLILGCKFITEKPRGVAFKSYGPIVEAALLVEQDATLSVGIDAVEPWSAVVNLDPSKGPKGPRGARTRPLIPTPWSAQTAITVMDDLLTGDVLARIADAAGKRCGLLDARTIDYGRCHIHVTERAA